MIWVKHFAGLQHAESDVKKFPHGSADDLHFVFAVASQALTEGAHNRIMLLGDHRRQKERFTHSGVTGL